MNKPYAATALLGLCWLPGASAHSFGKLYNLPVPFWMYLYGAAAALLVSFLIVGYFVTVQSATLNYRRRALNGRVARALNGKTAIRGLGGISVFCLALTVLAGLIGNRNPYLNINMTLFWILFVLGFTYMTALIGDLYSRINPWLVMMEWIERFAPAAFRGRRPYPQALDYYPALAFYMTFIWIELFAHTKPFSLSVYLLIYSGCNFLGAWLIGKNAWFEYCEFFSVFLRLIAKMAPLDLPRSGGVVQLRQPFIGLLEQRADSFSLLLFVLFMLSSTAYDGVRETLPWVKIFWKDIYPVLTPYFGDDMVKDYPFYQKLYAVFQGASLLLSPFFYLAIYLFFILLAKRLTRSVMPTKQLALQFVYSLLPIAFVYNITHYYTLIISQGTQILRQFSDPFGLGWNLFGTARWFVTPIVPDAGTVWHTQVWLILFGHIVSVYLAHLQALKVFPTQRQATLSQLPMLVLMVVFTTIGLWILSQPIQSGQVVLPASTRQ